MAYQLLPFRFERFNDNQYLLTNEVGEYVFLSNDDFHTFVNGKLDEHSVLFYDLASKQIATTDKVEDVVQMLATKFRTKKSILRDFTSLHMIVPTLRCNSSCIYCQVARKNMDDHSADMSKKNSKECGENHIPISIALYQNRVSRWRPINRLRYGKIYH